jgi:hypothetical protein
MSSSRATPSSIAASVPGQGEIQWSAWVAVFESRTSTTAMRAPFSLAPMMRCACGLK